MVQNDAANLYLYIDHQEDYVEDPTAPEGAFTPGMAFDELKIYVDVDGDKKVTNGVDRIYSTLGDKLCFQILLDDRLTTTPLKDSAGAVGPGFRASPRDTLPHRVWEIRLPLAEIQASPGKPVRLGFELHSSTPLIRSLNPGNLMQALPGPGGAGVQWRANFADLADLRR